MTEIDLKRYLRVIWRWRALILAAMLLAGIGSYLALPSLPRVYRSTTAIMVGEDIANPTVRQEDQQISQRVLVSYMGMVRREPILKATIDTLNLPIDWRLLQDRVVAVRGDTPNIFEIRVVDTSPERVQALAAELARQLVLQSPTLANLQQTDERRQFVRNQLDQLQASIAQGEADLAQLQAALGREVSARGVLERQDEIKALEAKLVSWRSTYAALLPAAAQTRGSNSLTIVEAAILPTEPISPNVPMTIALSILAGLALAIISAFVIDHIDNTVRGADDAALALAAPVYGAIGQHSSSNTAPDGIVALRQPASPLAENYRMVRTQLEQSLAGRKPAVFLVTAPTQGDETALVGANLAVSFAQAGRRTILIDADLRQPGLHSLFGLTNDQGLSSLLANATSGEGAQTLVGTDDGSSPAARASSADLFTAGLTARLGQLLAGCSVPNLQLLTAGPTVPDAADRLAAATMVHLLETLKAQADVIILTSPPALAVADAAILAAHAQVVMVMRAGQTQVRLASQAMALLRRASALPVGVVLTRVAATWLSGTRSNTPPPSARLRRLETPRWFSRHSTAGLPAVQSTQIGGLDGSLQATNQNSGGTGREHAPQLFESQG